MTSPNFDEKINRIGTHSNKWDALGPTYGIESEEGLAMWVADMDFKPPQAVAEALASMLDHGIFGYYGDDTSYRQAVCGWMQRRHGWTVDPSHIFTTHGLVNAVALCIQAYTDATDSIILFTPVYHAFARVIHANGRRLVESEMRNINGRYELDLEALESRLTGDEKMLVFCSPHNPGGRVWTRDELQAVCDFCLKHNLILISDEVHHDLVFPGHQHIPMTLVTPEIQSNLIMLTAGSKTFNMAGGHAGQVTIENADLRKKFAAVMKAGGNSPNSFGLVMTEAAYNFGDAWVDDLVAYLDRNRKTFDAGINSIPGLSSMNLESTYLSWVDFSGTGMERSEFTDRVQKVAKIATNHGPTFGAGGDGFLRFNIGTPHSIIEEAVARMQDAFSDLQ